MSIYREKRDLDRYTTLRIDVSQDDVGADMGYMGWDWSVVVTDPGRDLRVEEWGFHRRRKVAVRRALRKANKMARQYTRPESLTSLDTM